MIELVAVVGIIAIMSALVLGGFGGIRKSLTSHSGAEAVCRALQFARQQACIDGVTVSFRATAVDRFIVCRKAGVVSAKPSGTRHVPYNDRDESGPFIRDDYADFPDIRSAMSGTEISSADDEKAFREAGDSMAKRYSDFTVFNLTEGDQSAMELPPWYSEDTGDHGALLFKVAEPGKFSVGDEYGWVLLPEQTLPDGWAFRGSYSSDGGFKRAYGQRGGAGCVDFEPDGSTSAQDIVIELPGANGKAEVYATVKITGTGKVSYTVSNDKGKGQ